MLSSLFSNKNYHQPYSYQGSSQEYGDTYNPYQHQSQPEQRLKKINNFFETYLKDKIKEKKSFSSRFRQYGEPLLFSVPAATWLLGNYLKKPTLKKIGKYGIHTNLFYLVSKNCFGIYKAYENSRIQEYSPSEIIKDFCFNNTPVTILKNAIGGTLSFIKDHPSLFIAIAESIAMKKNEESEREKFQLNVSMHINASTNNYHATTDTSYNFKKKSSPEKEEIVSEKKDEKKEKEKTESHPLALVGLCLIPPIFLVTAIWACIENQPFFADCKALQKELENEKEAEYCLLQEHIKNIQNFNPYKGRQQDSDENQTKSTDYKKACEALIYNKNLIEKKSELLNNFFELEKNDEEVGNLFDEEAEEGYYSEKSNQYDPTKKNNTNESEIEPYFQKLNSHELKSNNSYSQE